MQPILLDLPMALHTERLLLRPPRAGDGPRVNAAIVASAPELAAWMPWANPTPSVQETEVWCRRAAVHWLGREQLPFNLYLKGTDTCVGACGLPRIKWDIPTAEIGYWVRTPDAGKGLIAEAVAEVTRFGLDVLKLRRLEIRCDDRNTRSSRVAERAGYALEGILRNDSTDPGGEVRSTRVYALIAD
ncbi:MAG TPA: GNAT family protein [Tepidisphaeraceae bacterium]|nr:GNAT family protein [Tepidisphaeraceae bacterium]